MAALICDDDPGLRRLYRRAFEWAGVDVVEAADGNECIELAVSEQPDLIVLDLAMPRRGGFWALPELRRRCPSTPVLVVTAHAAVEVFSRSRDLGATACFSKPGFLARIPQLVERYALAGDTAPGGVAEVGAVLSSISPDETAP